MKDLSADDVVWVEVSVEDVESGCEHGERDQSQQELKWVETEADGDVVVPVG